MLNSLFIKTDCSVNGITATNFRKAILSMIDSESNDVKSKIMFHINEEDFKTKGTRKLPYILFGKPKNSAFRIYGIGEEGLSLLKKIEKNLHFKIFLQNREFKIKDIHYEEKDFMPRKNTNIVKYHTSTPLILFTGHQRKLFDGIHYKYGKDFKGKDIELKKVATSLIINNLKFQMQNAIKDKPYELFDKIDINWTEFKVISIKNRDKTIIAIVGEFTSDWTLPQFIGRRIGNGFGEIRKINLDTSLMGKRVS